MKLYCKYFLVFLFCFNLSFSQEVEWQKTIGGNSTDALRSFIITTDKGFLLAGVSSSDLTGLKTENNIGNYDYWVVKLDSNANIQWQNTIGGTHSDLLYEACQTIDNGFLLAGHSMSVASGDKQASSIGTWDWWIVKLDSLGNIQWERTIHAYDREYLNAIIPTSDGNIVLAGTSWSMIGLDKTEDSYAGGEYWVMKIDLSGNILWQNTIIGNTNDYLYAIDTCSDGGFILGGYSRSTGGFDKSQVCFGDYDYWIVKIDSMGVKQWDKTIGGSNTEYLFSVKQTPDDGYIIAGSSRSDISGNKNQNSHGDDDYWILRLDVSGNILWQQTIGGIGNDYPKSVINTDDGGFLICGTSESSNTGEKTAPLKGFDDFWLVKLDSLGAILWDRSIGGESYESCELAIQTGPNSYLLAGESMSPISFDKSENSYGQIDYWIVKFGDHYNSITGNVFGDFNFNWNYDFNEPPITNLKITDQNSQLFTFTDDSGYYKLAVFDSGAYSFAPTPLNFYASFPTTNTANFSGFQQKDSLNNFAFQPAGTFNDLNIKLTPYSAFRSGMVGSYKLDYSNLGSTTISPTIVFYPDSNLNFINSNPSPSSVSLDSIVYNFGPLGPLETGSIILSFNISQGLPINTLIFSKVIILPIISDDNPSSNQSNWEVFITGSFDPNDIIVNRSEIFDFELNNLPTLDYLIRFQNTGNDTAFFVRIDNKITSNLDINQIEFVASSHPCHLSFQFQDSTLKFTFNNILLLDSNINEPMSHGFVRYQIKPIASVALGDSILNKANIIFDYNPPIVTNTAITKITTSTGLIQNSNASFVCFPNPTLNEIVLEWKGSSLGEVQVDIHNFYGQKVRTLYQGNMIMQSWRQRFDISELTQGLYFMTWKGKKSFVRKFIKL